MGIQKRPTENETHSSQSKKDSWYLAHLQPLIVFVQMSFAREQSGTVFVVFGWVSVLCKLCYAICSGLTLTQFYMLRQCPASELTPATWMVPQRDHAETMTLLPHPKRNIQNIMAAQDNSVVCDSDPSCHCICLSFWKTRAGDDDDYAILDRKYDHIWRMCCCSREKEEFSCVVFARLNSFLWKPAMHILQLYLMLLRRNKQLF